jgi:hypothetical protein
VCSRRDLSNQIKLVHESEENHFRNIRSYLIVTYSLQHMDVLNVILGRFMKKDVRMGLSAFFREDYVTHLAEDRPLIQEFRLKGRRPRARSFATTPEPRRVRKTDPIHVLQLQGCLIHESS